MILYPVLSKQATKQDTKLKSVILSDIRIPCNITMKAGWEKSVREAMKKPSGRERFFFMHELQPNDGQILSWPSTS